MSDPRKVGSYFIERTKIKQIMEKMLKPKSRWTREIKSQFEKAWENYWKAYDEHEKLCKK